MARLMIGLMPFDFLVRTLGLFFIRTPMEFVSNIIFLDYFLSIRASTNIDRLILIARNSCQKQKPVKIFNSGIWRKFTVAALRPQSYIEPFHIP